MCNAYRLKSPLTEIEQWHRAAQLPLVFDTGSRPNIPPIEMSRPTNSLPVTRPIDPNNPGAGVHLTNMRWWLVPFFHKGEMKGWKSMCTNARAETVKTAATFRGPFQRRRCLVPADGYFEWTWPDGRGKDKKSVRWLHTRPGGEGFSFAGLWDRHEFNGEVTESFTIVTTEPGPDAAAYHNRQPVLLRPEDWATWLDLSGPVEHLLTGSPAGELVITEA